MLKSLAYCPSRSHPVVTAFDVAELAVMKFGALLEGCTPDAQVQDR
jgi:hypothetical protein